MRNHPSGYPILLWDFDGVILDSMKVRDTGFEFVLKDYPKEHLDKLISYHQANGGLSRYVKFRYFFEVIRKEQISDQQINDLAQQFSTVMLRELPKKEHIITETLAFIKQQHNEGKQQHIVSGSDQSELRTLCQMLKIDGFFKTIQGSPIPKINLVKGILEIENYLKKDICLIGDSINDYEAASANEIQFFGYNNPALKTSTQSYILSFKSF
jgi:phosphoglycolate phosphatase-like HAD superfamily hydrolase